MIVPRATLLATGLLAGLAAATAAQAAPSFSAVYVFGDSLSDTGNVAETFGVPFPNPPSYPYSFTNGPPALSLLTQHFGGNPNPSLFSTGFADIHGLFPSGFVPGTNYAVGGATATDRGGAFFNLDLPHQVSAFVAHVGANNAPPSALYAMLIGGNDIRTAAHALNNALVYSGIASELSQLQVLVNNGAKTLLVSNVGDVGAIPEFTQASPPAEQVAAHADTLLYDQLLAQGVNSLRALNPGVIFDYFNLYNYDEGLLANAAALGFTNTTDPCYNTGGFPPTATIATAACGPADSTGAATNIDHFFYWDFIHPTARHQELWAEGMIAAVPEPAPLGLLAVAMVGLLAVRRRSGSRPAVVTKWASAAKRPA